MDSHTETDKPVPSFAGIVYGDVIYWGTLFGAVIAVIGSVWAFIGGANLMDVADSFTALWEGKNKADIWLSTVGSEPSGHWYLSHLGKGDALAMFGMAFGVFSVVPGMAGSAWFLFKEGHKLFAWLAIVAMLIIILPLMGLM